MLTHSQSLFLVASILLSTAAIGCGTSINYSSLNGPPRPMLPKSPDKVEIFTTSAPTRPFVEVGMIEGHQESGWSLDGSNDVLQKIRGEGAQRGCDGLVLTGESSRVTGSAQAITTLQGFRATCVVYKD